VQPGVFGKAADNSPSPLSAVGRQRRREGRLARRSVDVGGGVRSSHSFPPSQISNPKRQRRAPTPIAPPALIAKTEADKKGLEDIETEIVTTAAKLWGISNAELAEIQFSLSDL